VNPEEAMETGIYNRLTHVDTPPGVDHKGITVGAGHYCADNGGIVRYQGTPELNAESLIVWGRAGVKQGPIVLIVAGNEATYTPMHTRGGAAKLGHAEYTCSLYMAAQNLRSVHEGMVGDAASATRYPGLWQVKEDILDRLLNIGLVQDSNSAWVPHWVESGRLIAVEKGMCLYELNFKFKIVQIHGLTAYGDLTTLDGFDVTFQKKPDAGTGEEIETKISVTV